jgi:hypothetical protein
MWRTEATHIKGDSRFLNETLRLLHQDEALLAIADDRLHQAAQAEPLFAEALRTPQSPTHHAEGPFLRDHIRAMLIALEALVEEKMHVIDIEEFRVMKGYEGEIEELEEMIKEQAALFETYALCHDIGKWPTAVFHATQSSEGERLGFSIEKNGGTHPLASPERAKMRSKYLALFDAFAQDHASLHPQEIQQAFHQRYGIRIHYPGHAEVIFQPLYRDLLARVGEARGVPPKGIQLLDDLIGQHMDPVKEFGTLCPLCIKKYVYLAQERGYDADDYIDLLQGCLFLDTVCGSARLKEGKPRFDPTSLVNFFQSEAAFNPARAQKKRRMNMEEEKQRRNKIFREVGLDGESLLSLLAMQPGPLFGKALAQIHEAILGKGPLPAAAQPVQTEISRRMQAFYEKWFEKDI